MTDVAFYAACAAAGYCFSRGWFGFWRWYHERCWAKFMRDVYGVR